MTCFVVAVSCFRDFFIFFVPVCLRIVLLRYIIVLLTNNNECTGIPLYHYMRAFDGTLLLRCLAADVLVGYTYFKINQSILQNVLDIEFRMVDSYFKTRTFRGISVTSLSVWRSTYFKTNAFLGSSVTFRERPCLLLILIVLYVVPTP